MPEGDIIDENRGAFAGQVIANNYHWLGSGIESSSSESSSNGPNNNIEQNNSTINSQANSNNANQTRSSDSSGNYIGSTSGHFFPTSETSLNLDLSSAQTSESSNISSSSNPSNTNASSTNASSTNASKGQSVNNVPMPIRGPTETGNVSNAIHITMILLQHNINVIKGSFMTRKFFLVNMTTIITIEKDYYVGDDDDNFENDVEFGLYDYNRFDEECDIDHGMVNYDEDNYEYKYYKYKETHHGDHDDDDAGEDEDNEDKE